jgi:hypothetical protein
MVGAAKFISPVASRAPDHPIQKLESAGSHPMLNSMAPTVESVICCLLQPFAIIKKTKNLEIHKKITLIFFFFPETIKYTKYLDAVVLST